jgi:SAM-dependent methyltransferase
VAEEDRRRWDDRYTRLGPATLDEVAPPRPLAPHAGEVPDTGRALDVACGRGTAAVWLARRGLEVWGLDVSPVAIDQARDLARRADVADRSRFDVADLDDGLPDGPPVDLVVCHLFRDARLDRALIDRLVPGGLVAVTVLSEVGAGAGRFRAPPGELRRVFADLAVIDAAEGGGEAWLLARR